jgi:hypothetical protein
MNVYRIIPNSDVYEYIYARVEDRELLYFSKAQPMLAIWKSIPVLPDERTLDNSMNDSIPQKGDFPSLYHSTPVFSQRAWKVLSPLISKSVEALPLIHPSGDTYFAINVIDVIDCLDLTKTKITTNEVTGRVSSIQAYCLKTHLLKNKHMFKIPETSGLEVLVSEEFKEATEINGLKGLLFRRIS